MSNLREWLNELNFDWNTGTIIYHRDDGRYPGWSVEDVTRLRIDFSHSILDFEFDSGYGAPECPRVVAYDKYFVYFPCQYDGATWLEKISLDSNYYLQGNSATPYPGG